MTHLLSTGTLHLFRGRQLTSPSNYRTSDENHFLNRFGAISVPGMRRKAKFGYIARGFAHFLTRTRLLYSYPIASTIGISAARLAGK